MYLMKSFLSVIGALLIISCAKTEPQFSKEEIASESKRLNEWFETKFNERVGRSPEYQTYLGIRKDNDKWDDRSDEQAKKELDIVKAELNEIKTQFDYNKLDEQTRLSYTLFVSEAEKEIKNFKWRFHTYPFNQMRGAQSGTPAFLINFHRITDESDARAYISRLKGVKARFKQEIDGMKVREEMGIIAPKFVFPHVIRDSENILKGTTLLDDFTKKVNRVESIDKKTKSKLIAEAKQAIKSYVHPAYKDLISYMKELEKKATDDAGVWKFPEGEAFFNYKLQTTTTTDLTSDQIHEIGLKEVARIHEEMRKIKEKVNFKGDLQAFFKFMRTDKQFYYQNTDEDRATYMKEAKALIDNMKTRLDELFLVKPKADMIVKRVEPFREKSAGKAFYNRPAPDGSRPGIYYANLYRMEEMPKYEMEALAYHEGIPGHHMQLAIAQELEGIPKFRKFGHYTAYSEGWGLYTEMIPKEMGLYQDPYSDFGRLAMELWRACRLVVDTGIHSKKWTREQGIEYYEKNTPSPKSAGVKMVERHIVMPSQATAYKIGMLKIVELRENAKKKLGEKFDIREYHDIVLKNGPVPLSILEKHVDQWVSSKS